MLVVVALVAVVFGARVWLAGSGGAQVERSATPVPSGVSRGTSTLSRASPSVPPSGGSADATPSPSGAAPDGVGNPVLVVHVVGQVARPGVYRMAPGARVGDAVDASGGATRGADLTAVNLARVLVDGEQIIVPKPGQVVAGGGGGPVVPSPSAPTGASGPGGSAPGATSGGGLVSLNTADLAALDSLPGVGPVLAQRILDWRTEHGRFTSVDELGEVSGIGEKVLANLRPKVTL